MREHTRRMVVSVLTAVALAGCGSDDPATSSEWDEFPSGLQPSIDAYAADRDCGGLQATFDTVDAADGAHPDILNYIGDKMRSAGCYN